MPSSPESFHGLAVDGTTISAADIKAAAATIRGSVIVTDCNRSRTLSEICGCSLWLKFENLQFTSSFKERGALNRLCALSADERARGVIAMSAGNHAQGVAYHGPAAERGRLGCRIGVANSILPRQPGAA